MNQEYETVIGLEVHVELATKTKIFCACSTAFGGTPNSHTCPVCTGMPGALPVLNKKVLEHAIAVGLACNCEIASYSAFDRKNYFYPDNPQNYQISQLYLPICRAGYIDIQAPEGGKRIGIAEIHMEEDAGKLCHDEEGLSLVDYNRSGIPLIEIVTEPDMRNGEEVIAFLENLRLIIQYLGASDCKLQEGSMRVDVNLSVRKRGVSTLGTRTEMKNLGSFHAISDAICAESLRQIALLEAGQEVLQETRRFDEQKKISYSMRSKEDARDYRYFPDPDLMPIKISEEYLKKIRDRQPELPSEKRKRYESRYDIPSYDVQIITGSRRMADIFEAAVALGAAPKKVSNWLMGETLRLLKEREMEPEELQLEPRDVAKLIDMVNQKVITSSVAKEVFEAMFTNGTAPEVFVEEKGLRMEQDEEVLLKTIRMVLEENPKSVADYRSGKERALGFLVGQTMKAMRGKANPERVASLLKENL